MFCTSDVPRRASLLRPLLLTRRCSASPGATLQRPVELLAKVPLHGLDGRVLVEGVAAQFATCSHRTRRRDGEERGEGAGSACVPRENMISAVCRFCLAPVGPGTIDPRRGLANRSKAGAGDQATHRFRSASFRRTARCCTAGCTGSPRPRRRRRRTQSAAGGRARARGGTPAVSERRGDVRRQIRRKSARATRRNGSRAPARTADGVRGARAVGGVINRLTVPASNAEETRMHWFASSAPCEGQHSTLILIPKIGGPRHDQPGPALEPGPCRALHGQAASADRLARRGRRGGAERGLGEDVLECRPAPRPYVVSFASLIASSSVENTPTDSTGPKISSRTCGGDDAHQQRAHN